MSKYKDEYVALSVELVVAIHDNQIRDFGGRSGHYPDSVEKVGSTLTFMFESYFGEESYKGLFMKAGYMLYSLIKNHCFPDGNKRVAFNSCEIFLGLNGYELDTDKVNFLEFVENIAASQVRGAAIDDYIVEISEYLEQNSITLKLE